VTFNDHQGSTKSYAYTREHMHDVDEVDFVPLRKEITMPAGDGATREVRMHDGSVVTFRRVDDNYDPTDRDKTYNYLREHQNKGQVVTGLLYINEQSKDLHDVNKTAPGPLTTVPYEQLTPGAAALAKLQKRYR
jgi:2-oxoglutarate ferredoxin oxidoreductase subunit beta